MVYLTDKKCWVYFILFITIKTKMINSSDIINYKKLWFDWEKYIQLQKEKILERISKFSNWRLYLEIGWKFIFDPHAARVLPWFIPESKKTIFHSLKNQIEILFCVNAQDILSNRQLGNQWTTYTDSVMNLLKQIEKSVGTKPHIVINKIDTQNMFDIVLEFEREFQREWYRVRERYKVNWYPHNTDFILSEDWFWNDDHIPLTKNLILVTWAASSSWKMSTCLWQIYLDHEIWIESGYAKYETFPIWNIDLNHPINLAYEAATVDIWDYNCMDKYYKRAYWKDSVNYNRDIEAFEIVMQIAQKIVKPENFMCNYQSPTDMWISNAGFAITQDEIVSIASLQEIRRRKWRYQQMIDRSKWEVQRVIKCDEIEKKCIDYISSKWYNLDLNLE